MKPQINSPHEIRDYFNTRGRYQPGSPSPTRPTEGKAIVQVRFPVAQQVFSVEPNTAGPVLLLPRLEASVDVFPATATPGVGSYTLSGADAANYSISQSDGQITYNGPARASGTDSFTVRYETTESDTAIPGTGEYAATVNVAETQTPSFPQDIYSFSMPSDLDGTSRPQLVGQVLAAHAHSYGLSVPTTGFTINANSGQIYFVGAASSVIAGDTYTLEITARNTAGADTCQALITAKGRVSITTDPVSPDWAIPAGQAGPIRLGQVKVIAASDDTRANIPVPSSHADRHRRCPHIHPPCRSRDL